MTVRTIMEEYSLEIDDIRWYLSSETTTQILTYKDKPDELTRFVWSGQLADQLYNMEDRFLKDLQDRWDRGLSDEQRIREILADALAAKRKRARKSGLNQESSY
jgi:hypothetical protein